MKITLLAILIIASSSIYGKTPAAEIEFANCIQKTTISARNTPDSLDQLAQLIVRFKQAENLSQLEALTGECKDLKQFLGNYRRLKNSQRLNEFKEFNSKSLQSPKIKKLISDLFIPTMYCFTADVRAAVAFFAGFTVGVGGGYCTSTNGEIFLIFAPEAGAVGGIELSVMGGLKEFRTNAYGIFAAEENQDYGGFSWGLIGVGSGDFSHTDSVGIGMAMSVDSYYVGTMKILRVKRNLNALVTRIKAI